MSDAFLRWTFPFRPKDDSHPMEPPERAESIYVSRGFSPGAGRRPGERTVRRIGQRPYKRLLFAMVTVAAVGLLSSRSVSGPVVTGAAAAADIPHQNSQYSSLRGTSTAENYLKTAGGGGGGQNNTNRRSLTAHNHEENAAADSAATSGTSTDKKKGDSAESTSYPTLLHEQLKFNDNLDKPTLYYLLFASILLLLRKCLCFPCKKICCRKKKKKGNIEKMKFNDWEAWDDDEWEAFELAVTTPSPKDDPKSPKNKKKLAKEAKMKAKMDKQAAKEAKIKEKAEKAAAKEAKAKEKANKKKK